jgi:hypothetical protein
VPCILQENVDMMFQYLPIHKFKAVYVVDLCHSLCEQAKLKVKRNGWTNVHVIEGDACEFVVPGGQADLVTFSYSLSSRHLSCAAAAARAAPASAPPEIYPVLRSSRSCMMTP